MDAYQALTNKLRAIKPLPKLAQAAELPAILDLLETHLADTEERLQRLEGERRQVGQIVQSHTVRLTRLEARAGAEAQG